MKKTNLLFRRQKHIFQAFIKIKPLICFCITYLFFINYSYSQYSWEEVTLPQPGTYHDILFVDNTHGFIVGQTFTNHGFLLKTSDSGDSWQETSFEKDFTKISGIDFINETTGFVSAWKNDSSFIIKTTEKGENWNVIYTATDLEIFKIDFVSEDLGYGIARSPSSNDHYIIKITDDGATIDTLELTYQDQPISGIPSQLEAPEVNTLYVIYGGSSGTLYRVENETTVTMISPYPDVLSFHAIEFVNANNGFITTLEDDPSLLGKIYSTSDGGDLCEELYAKCCTTLINSLIIPEGSLGIAAGYYTGSDYNYYGLIVLTYDGGDTWQELDFKEDAYLRVAAIVGTNDFFFIEGANKDKVYRLKTGCETGFVNSIFDKAIILLYPNPNKGEFILSMKHIPPGKYSLIIYNMHNQAVLRKDFETFSSTKQYITLNTAPGYYFGIVYYNNKSIIQLPVIIN